MKRIFFISLVSLIATVSAYGQGQLDALRFSKNELIGTARTIGMGGAFGALGGDITGVAINPAGIGVYKSSEIVATMNFRNMRTQTDLNGDRTRENRFNFNFDNMAFVGAFPLSSDAVPFVNFGFSYNRLQSFNRQITMHGSVLYLSQTDYMAELAEGSPLSDLTIGSGNNPFRNGSNWLAVLGSNAGLIQPTGNGSTSYRSVLDNINQPSLDNSLLMSERGSVNSYDFNAGTTIADILSIGVTVAVTDLNYRMFSSYNEDFYQGDNFYGDYFLENALRTDGTGYQIKTGIILKPINELRIGVSYHSPTWYQMTDYYYGLVDVAGAQGSSLPNRVIDSRTTEGIAFTNYDFQTPEHWVFSLAGVIAQRAILSVDYELTNYANMKFRNVRRGSDLMDQNSFIEQDYRNASTLRVGGEFRVTPQLSARVGYAWMQSPYENAEGMRNGTADHPVTVGTVSQYTIEGDAHNFTGGLGYRFTPAFYTDIAFVLKSQKDDLYTFERSDRATLQNNLFSGLLTFGYRF